MDVRRSLLVSLLEYMVVITSGQLKAEIVSPLVYNAYLYSREPGTFNCVTSHGSDVDWIVDGVAHTRTFVRTERQIRVYTTTHNQTQHSVIKIPAIPVNQRIEHIKCKASIPYSSGDYQEVESAETAQFHIQGLLGVPPNITYSNYNITHNIVEWQEPETLNITNVEPDIDNYTICLNVTDECVNTTVNFFILSKFHVNVLVDVTAWNIVGESNSSAWLVIEACTAAFPTTGQDVVYHVEVVFNKENFTSLLLSSDESDVQSVGSNFGFEEECPYLYEVTIYQRSTQVIVSTQHVYGYHHFIELDLLLPRNQLYTAHINRTTSKFIFPLNFSTYDIQNVNLTLVRGEILQITLHFAAATSVKNYIIHLAVKRISVERSFNISKLCLNQKLMCSVFTSFDLSSILTTSGNLSINVSVLNMEEGGINSLYFQELSFVNQLTTVGNVSNTTFNFTTTNFTRENSTQMQTVLIITASLVGSALLGIGLLVCLIVLTQKKGIRQDCRSHHPRHENNSTDRILSFKNPVCLEMSQNEAYETSVRVLNSDTTTEPHLYDEIILPVPQLCQDKSHCVSAFKTVT